MTPPSRILVIRLSAIGDIVFASPLIAALRRAHPQGWVELGRRVRAFRAELRRQGFDLALDLQGLLKSGLLAWLSGARERIGLGSREGSQWLMTRVIPRGGNLRGIGSEYRFLAERLGLPLDGFAMTLVPGEEARAFARDLIQRRGLGAGYAVICPFTTRPQKHWFEERWAELAARLRRELDLPVLMLGGPADRAAAERIPAHYRTWHANSQGYQPSTGGTIAPRPTEGNSGVPLPKPAAGTERYGTVVSGSVPGQSPEDGASWPGVADLINLAGDTSLLQAAALIEHSKLVIGVDTGLSHMGIAFGRPTLLLFGSTRPYLDPGRANARVLYHLLPCSPCKRRPTCGGRHDCMRQIGVDEVLAAARDLTLAGSVEAMP